MDKPFRFTRSSRKHRIGRAHARYVIEVGEPVVGWDAETEVVTMMWTGSDGRGRELEILAVEKPDCILVIHVMPTHYRREHR